jgi:hypothetical protein
MIDLELELQIIGDKVLKDKLESLVNNLLSFGVPDVILPPHFSDACLSLSFILCLLDFLYETTLIGLSLRLVFVNLGHL